MSVKKNKSLKYFEPTKPIETAKDFTEELLQYKEDEGNDLFILEEGLEPLVEIDGKKYRCFLEHPRMIQSENVLLSAASFIGNTLGYKFVYLRPVDEE
ncbi:MAG: hypothetical protein Q4P65_04365 [Eubacteriales bacterium]|nr:hypothetical protein [Eubacteriales bacterium]